jgi:hypothetical protein
VSSLSTRSIFVDEGAGRRADRAGMTGGDSGGSCGDGDRLELRNAERSGLRSGDGWWIIGTAGSDVDGVSGTERSLAVRCI